MSQPREGRLRARVTSSGAAPSRHTLVARGRRALPRRACALAIACLLVASALPRAARAQVALLLDAGAPVTESGSASDAGSADAGLARESADATTAERAPASEPSPEAAPLQAAGAIDSAAVQALADQAVVDVTVRADSPAQRLRESARSLVVVELARAQRASADMGQVLARTQGISVRRSGALGADARLSLNGLSDEQVRLYVDGIPLELGGYPFGLVSVPLELFERVEIHRGVVPIRLGADALGGAIELVSGSKLRGTHARASYQVGSFDTQRLLASASHVHAPSGLYVRFEGALDRAANDYPIRVPLDDARGGQRSIEVRRNNDAYRSAFGSVEAGVVRRAWAKRLSLRGFFGALDKEIPSDPLMLVPYAEVETRRRATGALLRYESPSFAEFKLSATASYSERHNQLDDRADCAHDWVGRCVRVLLPARGERTGRAYDQHVQTRSLLTRLLLERPLGDAHELRLAVVPMFTRRTGQDRALPASEIDPLDGARDLFTIVSGVEHELRAFDEKLQNLLFVKQYTMIARTEEVLPSGLLAQLDSSHRRLGVGDGLRFRFTDELYAKLAYEWATRLPAPDQLFGDGALVAANLRLRPESAHNLNLEAAWQLPTARAGRVQLQVAGFARLIDDLIVSLVRVDSLQFDNVDRAQSLGVEGSARWTSPGQWAELEANATYQDYRNRSRRGEYAPYDGDRIPYRPYLFANGAATLFARGLLPQPDELSLTFRSAYVHEFFIGWESANRGGSRLRVPQQLVHSLAITLLLHRGRTSISSTVEVHNLSDERVFDFYGVQLPGRSFGAKLTIGV